MSSSNGMLYRYIFPIMSMQVNNMAKGLQGEYLCKIHWILKNS